ncbi:hypothetical protein GPJ56_006399 [Histomonas meleagridis]|uniref:uncharacterized protein n=1 Tax=Histomonas meleagridis TaxID=135588 RepID=UPI00355A2AEE|nr:hypothetical protein GPJ56_006399 [Histomonas meleagridis]KAH0796785.1 hypothetical protein GO595_010678 [Histomonas meleagridis]
MSRKNKSDDSNQFWENLKKQPAISLCSPRRTPTKNTNKLEYRQSDEIFKNNFQKTNEQNIEQPSKKSTIFVHSDSDYYSDENDIIITNISERSPTLLSAHKTNEPKPTRYALKKEQEISSSDENSNTLPIPDDEPQIPQADIQTTNFNINSDDENSSIPLPQIEESDDEIPPVEQKAIPVKKAPTKSPKNKKQKQKDPTEESQTPRRSPRKRKPTQNDDYIATTQRKDASETKKTKNPKQNETSDKKEAKPKKVTPKKSKSQNPKVSLSQEPRIRRNTPKKSRQQSSISQRSIDVHEDDDGDEDTSLPIALRRKKRMHVGPLRYWLGERLVYKPTDDGLSIDKIIKCDSTDED